jgi:hypothetical protein
MFPPIVGGFRSSHLLKNTKDINTLKLNKGASAIPHELLSIIKSGGLHHGG